MATNIHQDSEVSRLSHFDNLDGLRALAAFSVVFFHTSNWFEYPDTRIYYFLKRGLSFGGHGGSLGVTFFFILSGFLITYLMFVEQGECNKLNISFFYIRRVLRIWPLYYLTLFVGFLVYPSVVRLFGHVHTENASALPYLFFVANFDRIYNTNPNTGILGIQWSVAVEEQFYLLWPVFFYFFGKKRVFPFLIIGIIVASEWFFMHSDSGPVREFHLVSCFRFLAFGALLAHICYFNPGLVRFVLQRVNKAVIVLIYCACLSLLLFQYRVSASFFQARYLCHFLPYIFFGFVIVEQNYSGNSFIKIGACRMLNWLGKISYGLYMTHMIAIYIVLKVFPKNPEYVVFNVIASVLITIIISHFSYVYYEAFFLSLKERYRPATGTVCAVGVKD